GESTDRLCQRVTAELTAVRDRLAELQAGQSDSLARTRESIVEKIHQVMAEHGRAAQELQQTTLAAGAQQITAAVGELVSGRGRRRGEISGKVSERLDEGFRKTNETFAQVMARLATIDEAQRKIDGLTTNVVSLQELLGDKRARGAFGEVQLEA